VSGMPSRVKERTALRYSVRELRADKPGFVSKLLRRDLGDDAPIVPHDHVAVSVTRPISAQGGPICQDAFYFLFAAFVYDD